MFASAGLMESLEDEAAGEGEPVGQAGVAEQLKRAPIVMAAVDVEAAEVPAWEGAVSVAAVWVAVMKVGLQHRVRRLRELLLRRRLVQITEIAEMANAEDLVRENAEPVAEAHGLQARVEVARDDRLDRAHRRGQRGVGDQRGHDHRRHLQTSLGAVA